MIRKCIFNDKWLRSKYNKEINVEDIKYIEKRKIINRWIKRIEDGTITNFTEIQLQRDFISDIFSKVLGAVEYLDGKEEWNVIKEQKTNIDSKKADGILGYFTKGNYDTRAIIELKGFGIDLDSKQYKKGKSETPVEQAFSYVSKYGGKCKWVIVSNYNEIRLYPSLNQAEYEVFYITDLKDEEQYKRFLYLLSFDSMISRNDKSKLEELMVNNILNSKKIENEFYSIYRKTREELINDIKLVNMSIDIKIILNKVQKILDRFIFICFAEDKGLIPTSSLKNAIKNGENSYSKTGIWNELKSLFTIIDKGDDLFKINEFNGGLFKEDEILNNLIIPNDILKNLKILSTYDYDYDLNVNILGHIFEQSISDIEEIKSNIDGINLNNNESTKKINGIYYTPRYITKYMVENTIGEYLRMKRFELGEHTLPKITEDDINYKVSMRSKKKYTPRINSKLQKRLDFLNKYRDTISKIKVLDPACGSGAFLNEAFDYLYKVRYDLDKEIENITGALTLFDINYDLNRDILQNNLYGVDLNEESVEITKLSLWLKTANKNNKLTTLDNNIKCGNSLITDSELIGNKAFNWNDEFKDVINTGGFDIILGNPPYVDSELMKKNYPYERLYIAKNFATAKGNWDLYIPFWELSFNLLKSGGCMSFITPNKWLSVKYGESLRKYIKQYIYNISDYSKCNIEIFENVGVSPVVVFAKKEDVKNIDINIFTDSVIHPRYININDKQIDKCENLGFLLSEHYVFLDKLKSNNDLVTKYVEIEEAATVAEAYSLKEYISEGRPRNKSSFKVINTGTIERYATLWGYNSMCYIKDYYLKPIINKEILKEKFRNRYIQASSAKIIISGMRYFETVLDLEGEYLAGKSTIILRPKYNNISDLKFLNTILNSKLITFFLKESYSSLELDGAMNFSKTNISQIPIPKNIRDIDKIELEDSGIALAKLYNDIFKLNRIVSLRLVSKLNISKVSSRKLLMPLNYSSKEIIDEMNKILKKKNKLTMIEEDEVDKYLSFYKEQYIDCIYNINEIEENIDKLVYDLYSLTDYEIDIIENNAKHKSIFNNDNINENKYSYEF